MSISMRKIIGDTVRGARAADLAAIGLFAAALLSVANIDSNENLARAGQPAPEAESAHTVAVAADAGAESDRRLLSVDDALEYARTRSAGLRNVADYTATFSKVESVNRRIIEQKMELKFRRKPFSVYMQSYSKRRPAREVIFVAGKNDDMLLVHESGLKSLLTLRLKPDDPRVMAENRYSITEIGIEKLLETTLSIWDEEKDISPTNVKVTLTGSARLGSAECEVIEVAHKRPLAGLKYQRTRLSFDKKTGFPVQVEHYAWPAQAGETSRLVERYTYLNIRANVGLTDEDFNPANSDYRFRAAW